MIQFVQYANLKSELSFRTPIIIVSLSDRVIEDMICNSRSFAVENSPVENGAFMRTDYLCTWDSVNNKIITIANENIDYKRNYYVCNE